MTTSANTMLSNNQPNLLSQTSFFDALKFKRLINKKNIVKKPSLINRFMFWANEFTKDKQQEIFRDLNNL